MTTFTKEQLIEQARKNIEVLEGAVTRLPGNSEIARIHLRLAEITLATLTAPDDIPPHVLDAMSDMCDGGFDAQGIWDLCRASIMPPEPCSRCGVVSQRPDGAHYCHPGRK